MDSCTIKKNSFNIYLFTVFFSDTHSNHYQYGNSLFSSYMVNRLLYYLRALINLAFYNYFIFTQH
jgi:hypothetical protein